MPAARRPARTARRAATAVASVVLASGDPLVSGIGTTLIDLLGADAVRVHPAVSSVALAAPGWAGRPRPSDVVTVVGRDLRSGPAAPRAGRAVARAVRRRRDTGAAGRPAGRRRLRARAALTVLCDLGATARDAAARTVAGDSSGGRVPPLNVVAVTVPRDRCRHASRAGRPGLPDEAFEHDGQLTKRDVRASALARLAPLPGQLLWDLGAGAGLGRHRVGPDRSPLPGRRHRAGPGPGRPDRPQRAPGWACRSVQVVTADGPRRWTGCPRRTRSSSAAAPTLALLDAAGTRCRSAAGWSRTP